MPALHPLPFGSTRSAGSGAKRPYIGDVGRLSDWTAKQFDPALSWADVEWVEKRWGGKLQPSHPRNSAVTVRSNPPRPTGDSGRLALRERPSPHA